MIYAFNGFALDTRRRELRCAGDLVTIEPQAFDILLYLIEHRDRLVSRGDLFASIWDNRFVSDAALSTRMRDVRSAIGDTGKDQTTIKTQHGRGFRFIAEVREHSDPQDRRQERTAADTPILQEVQYLQSFDGTCVAFTDTGGPEVPVVKTANWMSHLEYDVKSPIWRHWVQALSDRGRLIRYDERGNGMSDWDVSDVTHEDCVADLECLVDHLKLDRFDLFGVSQGASVAMDYAVRHPERVRKIVIYGGFAQGWRVTGDTKTIGQRIAMGMLIRHGWGQESSEFRQLFTSRFMPGAAPEQAEWFNELQRKSVAPEMAAHLHDMFGTIDVLHLLDRVTAPTLVMHARGDAEIPVKSGRAIASGIPGARFVTLDSQNHILLEDEPAFAQLVEVTSQFLSE